MHYLSLQFRTGLADQLGVVDEPVLRGVVLCFQGLKKYYITLNVIRKFEIKSQSNYDKHVIVRIDQYDQINRTGVLIKVHHFNWRRSEFRLTLKRAFSAPRICTVLAGCLARFMRLPA